MAATSSAFTAVLGDGSVVTWGNPNTGGDSSSSLGEQEALRSPFLLCQPEPSAKGAFGGSDIADCVEPCIACRRYGRTWFDPMFLDEVLCRIS